MSTPQSTGQKLKANVIIIIITDNVNHLWDRPVGVTALTQPILPALSEKTAHAAQQGPSSSCGSYPTATITVARTVQYRLQQQNLCCFSPDTLNFSQSEGLGQPFRSHTLLRRGLELSRAVRAAVESSHPGVSCRALG